MKIKWHLPPLFKVAKFGFCPDKETWEAERSKWKRIAQCDIGDYPTTNGMCTMFRDDLENPHALICIGDRERSEAELIGIVVHEAIHVVETIFECAAERTPGEETRAYLTQHVVQTLWEDVARSRK